MESTRRPLRLFTLAALLAATTLFSGATSAFAHDGEIIAAGSDVFGQVFIDGAGKGHVSFNNVGDCPFLAGSCFVQLRWRTKCQWAWCLGFDDRSGWVTLPPGQDWGSWCYNEKSQWQVEMRWGWNTVAAKTIQTWGQTERVINADGSISYRMIGKFEFDVTDSTGYQFGTLLKTVNAGFTGYSDPQVVGTSGGSWLYPNC
jgi:hypothetical protein